MRHNARASNGTIRCARSHRTRSFGVWGWTIGRPRTRTSIILSLPDCCPQRPGSRDAKPKLFQAALLRRAAGDPRGTTAGLRPMDEPRLHGCQHAGVRWLFRGYPLFRGQQRIHPWQHLPRIRPAPCSPLFGATRACGAIPRRTNANRFARETGAGSAAIGSTRIHVECGKRGNGPVPRAPGRNPCLEPLALMRAIRIQ